MSQSLEKTTFNNISYNAIGKVIAFIFQSIANIVLSRELIAEDYGVVGFAMIFVSFMKNFSGFGINRAAVYSLTFNKLEQMTAFTLRQIIGLIAFIVTIAFSFVADHFIQHPAISVVIRVLAVTILIDNLSLVSTIHLERDLRFSVISMAETGLAVSSSIIAIILATLGFKYWSIVYGFMVANIVFVIITYCYVPYKFKFGVKLDIAKQYLKFGSAVFMSGLLSYIILNIDNFIIGAVAGASQLGYYAIAFNWGAMVASVMGTVVFGVLFPTFSRMQEDKERIKQGYLKIIQFTALFSILFNIGLFCVAENFLITVLGKSTDKWIPSLIALRILCFYGILRSLIEPASSLLLAQGNTRIPLMANLLVVSCELIFVYPAIKYGSINIVAIIVAVAMLSQVFIYLPALYKISDIRFTEIMRLIYPAIISGIIIFCCYFVVFTNYEDDIYKLIVSIISITLIYLLCYGVVNRWEVYQQLKLMLIPTREK